MKKYSVLPLFFTLCIFITSSAFGQSNRDFLNADSLLKLGTVSINSNGIVTLNGDTILRRIEPFIVHGNINADSMIVGQNGIIIPDNSSRSTQHYYEKGDKRYYIENDPPSQKAKQIDHSNVWLLNGDVAQAWH
jgi:hypothetical protein